MAKIELDVQALQAMMAKVAAEAAAAALAGLKETKAEARKEAIDPAKKAEAQIKKDAGVASAFVKRGFKDVILFDRTKPLASQPDVTVLTYNKWFELGRKVKAGEKAVMYKQFRLFHKSQTEVASVEERKAQFQKMQEAIARHNAENGGATA